MTTRRGRLPYVNKDYDSIREELIERIPQLTDRWTDFNVSDLGVVLLELFAGIADMLAYYIDSQAAECYLPTARQRQNVMNLCSLINYRLHGPLAAGTQLRFTLDQVRADDVTIPAGTVVRAVEGSDIIPFATSHDIIIPAESLYRDADALQGEPITETFTSSGEQGIRLVLNRNNVAHGSVRVRIGDSDWQEVEHFNDSGPEDMHFRVETDALDVTLIVFGDGEYGAYPNEWVNIEVSYLSTLGPGGNLAPGRITELLSTIYAMNGESVGLSVENPIPATGGAEKESLEHARAIAPSTLRSVWKAVTKPDYAALCLGFPGVAKAKVMDINDDGTLRIYTVRVCVAPEGGGIPSSSLKQQLTEYLEERRLLTIDAGIVDPVYLPVNVSAELYMYRGESPDDVRERATDVLSAHFAFENQDFGKEVYLSDLIALLDGVAGVSHVVLRAPSSKIVPTPREIPMLGTVTLDVREVL